MKTLKTALPKPYLEALGQKARTTQDKYLVYLRRYVADLPEWPTASPVDVVGWLARVSEERTPAVRNLALSSLKHLYRWAGNADLVREDPTRSLATRKYRPRRAFILDANDVEKVLSVLLNRCRNTPTAARDCALVLVLAATSMRVAQAVALNWRDLDLGPRPRVLVPPCKGSTGIRVGLANLARDALAVWRNAREDAGWRPESPAVFCGRGTDRLTTNGARQIVKRILAELGYKGRGVGPHLLRVAFVTAYLAEHPGDAEGCVEFTGHADPRTLKRYDRPTTDQTRLKVNGLGFLRGLRVPGTMGG